MILRGRKPRRLVAARGRQAVRGDEFYEDFPPEIIMVGSLISDWGPSEEPRRWLRRKKEEKKPPFGFARAMED